jgi:hypothetical protein
MMRLPGLGVALVCLVGLYALSSRLLAQSTVFFQETFEDANVSSRGWYDTTGVPLSTAEKLAGTGSLECHFVIGGTSCAGGNVGRHTFPASDSVYLSFYIKHTATWMGSGKPYGPHMFYVLTTEDGPYAGPAYTRLTAYVEEVRAGEPLLSIQDGRNIDETRVGQDLTAVTELRALAGCNGDSDGYGNGECYPSGSVHWNAKKFYVNATYFDSTPGSPKYKGDWHLVEAYFRLNSISSGKGNRDGIIRYWYDGGLVMERLGVVMRTGARSTMKFNQLLISPFMGDGSPVDQGYWIDNLEVASDRPSPSPPPPNGSMRAPAAPTNLRIIR